MKRSVSFVVAPMLVALVGGTSFAQQSDQTSGSSYPAATSAQERSTSAGAESGQQRAMPGMFQMNRASKIIGADVLDSQGARIGDVHDVMLDPVRGQVAYAVVSLRSPIGLATRYYVIPWPQLRQASGMGDRFVTNLTRDQLKAAPSFDRNKWPDMAAEQWHRDVARFYSQSPYWEGSTNMGAGPGAPGMGMGGAGTGGMGGSGRGATSR